MDGPAEESCSATSAVPLKEGEDVWEGAVEGALALFGVLEAVLISLRSFSNSRSNLVETRLDR